jgi:hypothetical protein
MKMTLMTGIVKTRVKLIAFLSILNRGISLWDRRRKPKEEEMLKEGDWRKSKGRRKKRG